MAVHLDGRECESSHEAGTVADDGRALRQHGVASGFVGDVDDEGKVFRAEEGRNSGFDEVESFLEPRRGGMEPREPVDLPGHKGG